MKLADDGGTRCVCVSVVGVRYLDGVPVNDKARLQHRLTPSVSWRSVMAHEKVALRVPGQPVGKDGESEAGTPTRCGRLGLQ